MLLFSILTFFVHAASAPFCVAMFAARFGATMVLVCTVPCAPTIEVNMQCRAMALASALVAKTMAPIAATLGPV